MRPFTVVIPWRASPSRVAAFEFLTAWYAENMREATVMTVDTDDDVFVLAACRNIGVSTAQSEAPDGTELVIVVNDADTVPDAEALRRAVDAAHADHLVHLPYTAYHWLGAEGTAQLRAGTPAEDCAFELISGACSGVYVTTARTWAEHGGQDERFRGWGFEDAAWFLAHETLLGAPPARHDGRVYAMHHVAEARAGEGYDANAALMDRYRAASGDPTAMAQLVGLIAPAANRS